MPTPPTESANRPDERLQLAVRASGLGIYDHDHRTGALFWSPEMHRICGTQADSPVTFQTYVDLVHPEDRDRVDAAVARAHDPSQGGEFEIEHRIVRHDGEVRWITLRSQTTFEGEGNRRRPARTVGAILDVSERRRREEALYFSDNRLQEAIRVAKFGIFDHDHATDTIYWSAEQRANYGWGPNEEVTLAKFVAQVYEADRERVWAAVQRAHDPRGDGRFDIEHRIVRRDGQVRWLTTRSQSFFEGEGASRHLTRTIGAVLDVTERTNAEHELRRLNATLEQRVAERTAQLETVNQALTERTAQAETATRAKSAFLANMSHEIRTPLNAIIGLTHLIARDCSDEVRERLGKIDTAAKHLLQVINDVLDLSKIEAGKMVLEEREFSLDDLLSNAFEIVGASARGRGLELVLDTDDLPDRLRGDPTRLLQAVINLLGNAVKFTQSGWVRLRGSILSTEPERLHVRFEVQDTGEGIAAERQGNLFQAFEQADNSPTRLHGGTGLGLALTRHLAEMMGGKIGLHSEPGVGSTFWFTAWLGRGREAAIRGGQVELKGLRALLVDDLPEALTALGDRLRALGIVVDAQPGGLQAIARVEAEKTAGRRYDLMLVDWRMEPLDGIETLKRLHGILGVSMPRSILVTAFDDPTLWREAAGLACDAVLIKPITASVLHDTLVRVLGRGPAPVRVPRTQGSAERALRDRHARQRILLVEDNLINREVAEHLLNAAGLTVVVAEHGAEAVALASSHPCDLVLMDVQMPVMDGLEATRQIRQRLGSQLPIIAMTANAFLEDRTACLDVGMNDHVIKPVDPEALYEVLLRWLPSPGEYPDQRIGSAPPRDGQRGAADIVTRLAGVDGFDVAAALRHVNEQPATLIRVLSMFVAKYRGGIAELSGPASEDARSRWLAACHTLRGACSALGCSELAKRLSDFEQTLAATTDTASLLSMAQQLNDELLQLVGRLAAELAKD